MSTVTIYHNPQCGTSRKVLAALREAGIEPEVIQYLKTPPDRATLQRLARDCGVGVRGLLRAKGGIPDDVPEVEVSIDGDSIGISQLLKQAGLVESTSEAMRAACAAASCIMP